MRIGAGLAIVAAAIILFIVLQGGDDGSDEAGGGAPAAAKQAGDGAKPKPAPVPLVNLKGGQPVGGVQDLRFTSGERVRFEVRSDVDGEVHVHGYELTRPVNAGGKVGFDFPADLEGGYEVELHQEGGEVQIADLVVAPG
ncbi:MAG: hypothetical protein ACRDKV_09690 [Solirubrobacterales bacterium]